MAEPISIDATIKSAFNSIIKMLETKMGHVKGKKTVQEYKKLEKDIGLLKEVAANPKRFFQLNDGPNDKFTLSSNLLDLRGLGIDYSPNGINGVDLLDSLILYTAAYYQDKPQQYDTNDKILELNKIIKIKSATGIVRALSTFRGFMPAEHFAVHTTQK